MLFSFKCPPKPPKFPDGCDIPRGSKVTISSLPHRNVVFSGVASKSASVDLDPGKYICRIHWASDHDGRSNIMNWTFEFYVGMDEKTWKAHVSRRPRFSKAMQGTEGPVWQCGFMGCSEEYATMISMVEHEYLHYGVKLFEATDRVTLEDADKKAVQMGQTIRGAETGTPVAVAAPVMPPVTKLASMPMTPTPMPDATPVNPAGVPLMTGGSTRPSREG